MLCTGNQSAGSRKPEIRGKALDFSASSGQSTAPSLKANVVTQRRLWKTSKEHGGALSRVPPLSVVLKRQGK